MLICNGSLCKYIYEKLMANMSKGFGYFIKELSSHYPDSYKNIIDVFWIKWKN